ITAKSEAIVKAIKDATAKISGAKDALVLQDALKVSDAANKLQTKTDQAIADLIAKKPLIAKANQVGSVKSQLSTQKAGSEALSKAIVGKMPALAQSVAKAQSAKIGAAI